MITQKVLAFSLMLMRVLLDDGSLSSRPYKRLSEAQKDVLRK